MTAVRPQIVVDPAMRFGQPNIRGVPVFAVCGPVWAGDSVAETAEDFGLSRAEVLVACWYAGTYGLPDPDREALAAVSQWRARWGAWADEVHGQMWRADVDWDAVPDPPARDEVAR